MSYQAHLRRVECIDRLLRRGAYPNTADFAAEIERVYGDRPSDRTIGRDIDELKRRGAPIAYDPSRHGYRYTQENWAMPALIVNEGELLAVLVAERALAAYRNSPYYRVVKRVFDRLVAHLPHEVSVKVSELPVDVTLIPDPVTKVKKGVWTAIRRGIRDHRSVAIHYRAPGYDKPAIRFVDPLHVVGHRGEWYLLCYSHRHESIRVYAFGRIERASYKARKPFTPPADFRVEDWIDPAFGIFINEQAVDVAIRFTDEAATIMRERRWHPNQRIETHDDGAITVRFRTNQQSEVLFWVSRFGPAAEILEPAELRERAAEWFRGAAARYG